LSLARRTKVQGNRSTLRGVLRPMKALRLVRLLVAVAALVFVLPPTAVLADCMMPAPIQEAAQTAEIVFVGTVAETSNHNSWASVQVEEVWRGPDLEAAVIVKGGPAGNMATSVDRFFEAGVKYLFFPYVDAEGGGLADNSCSNTVPWSADLAPLRPADARPPVGATENAEAFDVGGLLAPLGVAVLVGGLLLVAGLLARGRTA
jgi:hypothetical protein